MSGFWRARWAGAVSAWSLLQLGMEIPSQEVPKKCPEPRKTERQKEMPTADQGQLEAPEDGIEVEIGNVKLLLELGPVEVRPGHLVGRHVCGGGVRFGVELSPRKLKAEAGSSSEAQSSESRPGRVASGSMMSNGLARTPAGGRKRVC